MKKTTIAVAVAVLALAGGAGAGDKSGHKFSAKLSGANEVPPVASGTTGDFRLTYDDFDGTASYRFRLDDGKRVFMAHIHCAVAGQNGPVVLWLAGAPPGGSAWDVDGKWIDNASVTDADITNDACGTTLAEIVEAMRNGKTYVNVHTLAKPGGEVRGQIEPQ